ncbi:MAG: hypothetical protein P9M13_01280 [Candidatus Ancaeobacter aquaticus]|nr:hypothetical protein [Candidatus Ancaeobacter aquaticus]
MYKIGFWITAVIVFIPVYIYAIATYGLFGGVCFGWIPAAIIGALLGLIWPLTIIALIVIIAWLSQNGVF